METVRYSYRLRPGAHAGRVLRAEWGRCRWLWNEAVHQLRAGRKPTLAKLGKLLTAARKTNGWLREGWQDAQQGALRTFLIALNASFTVKGRGRPKIEKRKGTLPSLEFSRNGFAIVDGRLRLPKSTLIPVVWSRELPSEPTSVRVYQDSIGHWYASFVVRRETEPLPETDRAIGIDWGVTTTDPAYDLPHVGARRAAAKDLAAAQRTMARRRRPTGQGQSKGYQRATVEAAKVAKKAARRNTDVARTILAVAERGHTSVESVRHAEPPSEVSGAA